MRKISVFLVLFFSINIIIAQEFNISELKKQSKNSIVQFTLKELYKRDTSITALDYKNVKVMANRKSIYLQFFMGLKKASTDSIFENYEIEIYFYEKSMAIYPQGINLKLACYNLTSNEKKQLNFVLKDFPNALNDESRIQIEIKKDFYELTFSRDMALGSECFIIEKKTGEKTLKWHEHPFGDQFEFSKNEDPYFEIE